MAYGRVDTGALLQQAIAKIAGMERPPELVLLTGDLTDCGLIDEYRHLRELLAGLDVPVYMVPGNHDRRENLRNVFADDPAIPKGPGPIQYVVDSFDVRLIALDTVVEGEGYGALGPQRLQWLAERLAEAPARPTVIFMHHPPFCTGMSAMDRIGCRDGDALGTLIQRHPQVQRVLCGHVHRPIQMPWCGTLGCVAPSTAHQLILELDTDQPERFCLEPPGFLLHWWDARHGMATHTCVSASFPGPYDIELDPDYPAYQAS